MDLRVARLAQAHQVAGVMCAALRNRKNMADLVFMPIADKIKDASYSCYDGACGTGGMLTVAQDRLLTLAKRRGKEVAIHLFGQEINPETYAICTADNFST